MGFAGAAIAGSAALGAGTSMMASGQAAGSAKDAANMQKMAYLMTRADLSPYNTTGQSVLPNLNALATSGPTGGGRDYVSEAYGMLPGMTLEQMRATPGYQFTLEQGLKGAQSAAAARGLGVSGASLKGAATYATGLADSTYANRFNESQQRFRDMLDLNTGQLNQLTNQYTRLHDTAALGENAAASTGTAATQGAQQYGQYTQAAGTAEAQGIKGIGNALNEGIGNYLQYQRYQQQTAPAPGGGLPMDANNLINS